jgi:glutamyl-Q tRNA(Asp) synthetase
MPAPFPVAEPPDARPVFRFAPSPNGYLHLGHARSALLNAHLAARMGGRFLVRIEDIDPGRTRETFVKAIEDDLAWLGLEWERPVLRQSTRFDAYRAALAELSAQDCLYPCFCSRQDVATAVEALGDSPPSDPDGAPFYPGTCRRLSLEERARRIAREPYVLRIDMQRFAQGAREARFSVFDPKGGAPRDCAAGPARWGDAVIMRKDCPASYHLAVVVDDAFQGVTHVARGADLREATHLHAALQHLLGLPRPLYWHHDLVLDADGRKLSKSIGSTALRDLRAAGATPGDVRAWALAGLAPIAAP